MSDRPFRVLGVQQIAVGGADKAALRAFWVDLLGFTAEGSYRSERENVDEDITSVGRGLARVEFDLMQPIDPSRSPRVHEPTLNHVGLWIDDLPTAVTWLTALPRAVFAAARRASTCASCTPRATLRRRAARRARWSNWCRRRPR